jgi:hypothetical protein
VCHKYSQHAIKIIQCDIYECAMLRVELRKKVCTVLVISLAKEGSKDLVETKTGGRLEFCCCYLVDFSFAETESKCDKYEQLTSLFS